MPQVTITFTAAQAARMAPAFGDLLHPGTDATLQDLKDFYVQKTREVVQQYEAKVAAAAMPAPAAFDPT